jgi:transposase-like protein
MAYSEAFRRRMVARMCGPNPESACSLARETGVCQQSLSRWLRLAGTVSGMATPSDQERPRDHTSKRTAAEKRRLVTEADGLNAHELGEFLRRNGLHAADIQVWREILDAALEGPAESAQTKRQRREEAKKITALKRELRRKEKALAEAAALLVLQKKVQEIWGEEDDDTPQASGS